jgi:hypothetical protein
MMPELKECKICTKCHQLIIHPHITECPSCGWLFFWQLDEIVEEWLRTPVYLK